MDSGPRTTEEARNTWQKGGSSGTAPSWATASACVGGLEDPYIFHTLGFFDA
jgi:hypothetical protein